MNSAPASDPNFMTSLARGLKVLEAFAELGPEQTVADLARHTGLPRGVVARCLHTLVVTGYVARDDRHFTVRPGIVKLANAYLSDRSLAAIAQPLLENLRDAVGESCSLGVLDGADVLYVARASRSRIMTIDLHVGSRLPAWCTSMGRVLLAALPPGERDALIPPSPLPPRTPHSASDRADLDARIDEAARKGFALVDQELEVGLRSIAVPVRDNGGKVIAALNIGANAFERSVENLETHIAPKLMQASARLTAELRRQA